MKYSSHLLRFALALAVLSTGLDAQARLSTLNCPAPSGLGATPLSSASVVLSWNRVSGATGYLLEVEQEPSGSGLHLETSVSDTFYVLNALQAGIQYKFKVRTRCGNDKSDWSDWLFFTVSGGGGSGCSIPAQLTASKVNETTATLTWAAVAGALYYTVEVETEPSQSGAEIKLNTTDTVLVLSPLKPGTTYKAKVRAHCSGGKSDWSAWVIFKTAGSNTGSSSCPVPTNITVAIQDSTALISWDAMTGAAFYSIEIEAKPGSLKWQQTVTGNSFTFKNLSANTLYKVKVRTHCADGTQSAWSKEIYFTSSAVIPGGNLFSPCPIPVSLQATNLKPTSADLSWSPVVGAAGYQIEIERQPSTGTQIKAIASSANYTALGLEPGRTYKFKVRTLCAHGNRSKWSQNYSFQTPPALYGADDREQIAATASSLGMLVAPNPATTTARLILSGLVARETLRITLYDLSGRTAWEGNPTAEAAYQEVPLPIHTLAPGLYLLRVEQGAQVVTQKMIISR